MSLKQSNIILSCTYFEDILLMSLSNTNNHTQKHIVIESSDINENWNIQAVKLLKYHQFLCFTISSAKAALSVER